MKKIFFTILFILFLLSSSIPVGATNSYTAVLNGTSQYFDITSATGLEDTAGNWTISIWVKLDTLPSVNGRCNLFSKDDGNNELKWRIDTDNKIDFYVKNSSSQNTNWTVNTAIPSDGSWHNYAVAVNVLSAVATFYQDGEPVSATLNNSALTFLNVFSTTYVGYLPTDSKYCDGDIDDLRFYSSVLTDQQISDYYNCDLTGDAGEPSNLQGLWRFDNDATDDSGNGNDLTAVNSPTYQSSSFPFTYDCGYTPPSGTSKKPKPSLIKFE